MPKNAIFSGEDKVIVVALGIVGVLGALALVALILAPTMSGSVIPVLSVAIAAISVLAARHPPNVPDAKPVIPPPVPTEVIDKTSTQAL